MSEAKKAVLTKAGTVVLPPGIITFAAIARKWIDREKEDDSGAYIANVILPPDSDLTALKNEVNRLGAARFKDNWKKATIRKPFLRAEEKLDPDRLPEGFDPTGWILIRAKTYRARPNVVYANTDPVAEEDIASEVYNGREAIMSVRPKDYDNKGNKGVTLYLSNIQLLRKLKAWPGGGARVAAEDEFTAIDIPEDEGGGKKAASSVFEDEVPF